MAKIHCLNPISPKGTDRFPDSYKLVEDLNSADAVLVRSASMKELQLPAGLLAIARAGAGVNNIPLDKCAEQGIVVFNTPGANANGVKEEVLCGMLLAARDIVGGIEWVQTVKGTETIAKDVEKGKKAFAGTEISGKVLGVIGLGAIGVEVANAASGLGMKVMGYDPFLSVNAAWKLSRRVQHVTDIAEIYRSCDYITVHVPLSDKTRGMIGKDQIALMKAGAVVLNFARDALVDDAAMAAALNEGRVKRYVTDFPNPQNSVMKGCLCIPHLGASTEESEDNCACMAADELTDYLENGNISHSVNYPDCDMGVCKAASRIAILHRNVPNMIGQITGCLAAEGVNISNLTNKSRDQYAYTLLDLDAPCSRDTLQKLCAIEGVLKVRTIC